MSKSNFSQLSNMSQDVHFSRALMGDVEHSQMTASSLHLTTFNAGRLVPVYCREILPNSSYKMSVAEVIRQTTLLTPTMGEMELDLYAFFVPNRIVNHSWKAVQGENYSGSWVSPDVTLAPLVADADSDYSVPVGSVADYYGFPTQGEIPGSVLSGCHDLKFRGYVMIWNEYFRDQNYQAPLPISYLNVYQGFFDSASSVPLNAEQTAQTSLLNVVPDGSVGAGAVRHAVYGTSTILDGSSATLGPAGSSGRFRALDLPLKVNKFHDYFTSVLPSPQKSLSDVLVPVSGTSVDFSSIPVRTGPSLVTGGGSPLIFGSSVTGEPLSGSNVFFGVPASPAAPTFPVGALTEFSIPLGASTLALAAQPLNLQTDPVSGVSVSGLSYDISDLRMAAAIQQYYETLARGGSRYRELVNSFFGISVPDPYSDIPQLLGHVRRPLDLFQTAQTSASSEGNTPQGNLAAFGYTSGSDFFFEHTFVEHGYLHVFAVVRHRNIYSSYLARDNFRLSALDFYTPSLANISNQPVYSKEINPFVVLASNVFGYQEAWAEYRFEPDYVTSYMRPGVEGSLAIWNYADLFDATLQFASGSWLQSNSEQVLDRTLAVDSTVSHQFKAAFKFEVWKDLPMPTYSVPGMDII